MTDDSGSYATNHIAPELPKPLIIRSELISTAINFLADPQVKAAPISQRLAFLEGKGLTADEIDLALLKSGASKDGSLTRLHDFSNSKPQAQKSHYKGIILTTAVILGTGSLIISNYQNIKSFAKKFFNQDHHRDDGNEIKRVERELKQHIKELKDLIEEKEILLQEALNLNLREQE